MKRILFLHAGSELYGADVILFNLVTHLDKKQYRPIVILPNNGPLATKLKKNSIEVHIIPYPILRRQYFTPTGIIKYIYNYFKYSTILRQFCLANKIDIIHANTSAVLEGTYLQRKTNIAVIYHIHEILQKPKVVAKFINKHIAKYSTFIICVSRAAMNNFIKQTNVSRKKITTVHNGIDNSVFNPHNRTDYLRNEFNIKKGDIVVGMIGRVNAWKGQNDFVDAVSQAMVKDHRIRGLIVGGVFAGQEWRIEDLKQRIRNSDNQSKFILSNYRTDTPNIHCLIDILVLPSTQPDPLPTVVLESMASGKPIVAYKHGGVCEMVKHNQNGLLLTPLSKAALCNSILDMCNSIQTRKHFGEKSISIQHKFFSIESFVNQISRIYAKVGKE